MATADFSSTSRNWPPSASLNLPIKYFVLNNDGYASIRASQSNFFGSPQVGCDERTGLMIPDLLQSGGGLRHPVRAHC